MGWDWLPGRPLTCFGRGRPNPGSSPGQALPLPSERVKSDAPLEELGTDGGNRLAADHTAHRCSGSRGKGYAARREGGQATAAMLGRSRMDRWAAAGGGGS